MGDLYSARRLRYKRYRQWVVERDAAQGGPRLVAEGMGEKRAKQVARLLNDDEVNRHTPRTMAVAGRPAMTAARFEEMTAP